ncbi:MULTISPECIES: phosphopyruvate hydratase [unclassified Clostridium]|uniref:phosphopyruvate hydratase n=1 Tax=unclassified Clostridium TaxID=2614128 RepID=UPI00029831B5|nr:MULTISPECIES: phosphopyruvate hydratase [unclassified Clostridium]EKQ54347.1 MAG: phosphopyruvate hydratase [Clostridium sp. Maddingley MBC34-26]
MSKKIQMVTAREIFDSRGNPTIEVDVVLEDGSLGRASVPSGASTGDKEAVELRDGGKRLNGKGVSKVIENVNGPIREALIGLLPFNQELIDKILIDLDGTTTKMKLGANAILGTSMAVCRAAAQSEKIPIYRYLGGIDIELPLPFFNVINGGKHADSGINIQEFLITPIGFSHFREGMESISEVYHMLKRLLGERGLVTSVGDEGGFAPHLKSSEEAIELLIQAIEKAGYIPQKDIAIALDPAASEFYENGVYDFEGKKLTSEEMTQYYKKLVDNYPIISIEDGLSEHDWDGWDVLTKELGNRIQLVGDDIFVTNPSILQQGIEKQIANSVLIKLNQIGTITETIETIRLARKAGYTTMISHRSGETEDTFIADFAVGLCAGQIKTGSMARSERVSKYNQFLRIQEELGKDAIMTPFKLKK